MSLRSASQFWPFRKRRPTTGSSIDVDDSSLLPVRVLRLDSSRASGSLYQTISLGSVICYRSEVFVVVETTAPLPRTQSSKRHAKTRGTLFQKLPDGDTTAALEIQYTNSPRSNTNKDSLLNTTMMGDTAVPTWVKNELQNAEILQAPRNQKARQSSHKKSKRTKNRDVSSSSAETNSESKHHGRVSRNRAKIKHGAEELARLEAEKAATEARLRNLECEHKKREQTEEEVQEREKALQDEIEALRKQLSNQQQHFQSHAEQMQSLQKQLATLQAPTSATVSRMDSGSAHRQRSRLCAIQ